MTTDNTASLIAGGFTVLVAVVGAVSSTYAVAKQMRRDAAIAAAAAAEDAEPSVAVLALTDAMRQRDLARAELDEQRLLNELLRSELEHRPFAEGHDHDPA